MRVRLDVSRRWSAQASSTRHIKPLSSSIRDLQADLKEKRCSAREICEGWFKQLHAKEAEVNSFLFVNEEDAMAQADQLDKALGNGGDVALGPLAGVPIAIKDNICTQGLPTTAASRVLEGYRPTYDATVVEKLKEAGAIIMGKTNMDEFGMGNSTENSAYKMTRNPWDTDRVPGGSSGGSASSIAAQQCPVSLGTDTGGSIRQPAHFCGCVGIKPSYGRVSRYGLISYGSSLDTIGPMAQNVKDAALVLQTIAGVDSRDATSANVPVADLVSDLKDAKQLEEQPLKGKRIGIIQETMGEGVDPAILEVLKRTIQHMESLGVALEEVSIKDFQNGLPSYYIIALSEASSNLSRYDGVRYGVQKRGEDIQQLYMDSRMAGLGAEVKRRILMGTYALSAGYYDAYYKRAQQVRTLITRELNEALKNFDALITPAAPTLPWKIGEFVSDPLATYKADLMSVGCNLAGLPGIVLPVGTTLIGNKSLPVGMQLLGRSFEEKSLIEVAHVLEQTWDAAVGMS